MKIKFTLLSFLFFVLVSCDAQVNTSPDDPYQKSHPEQFANYWYAGQAELNRYELEQMRYGESRTGEAVLVFVTEDFLLEEQVKKEFGNSSATSVLKLNFMKKFITGIYDYSVMTSAFTPIDFRKHPATLKVTFSSQDWCGQAFSQMNYLDRKLNYQVRSYFQSEGDKDKSLDATYTEDDIWNRIRLEPQTLPLGKIEMVPSMEYLRLKHKELKAYRCEANLYLQVNDSESGDEEFYSYQLSYPELDRKLEVICESRFPFKVLGWKETWSASSSNPQVTEASLTKSVKAPYWNQNGENEKALRDSLGLKMSFD
ncbi:MAG: septum formation inhibitor Maf [Bacteroidota bacterium]